MQGPYRTTVSPPPLPPLPAVEWVMSPRWAACPCCGRSAPPAPSETDDCWPVPRGRDASQGRPRQAVAQRASSLAGSLFLLVAAGALGAMTWVMVDAHALAVETLRAAQPAAVTRTTLLAATLAPLAPPLPRFSPLALLPPPPSRERPGPPPEQAAVSPLSLAGVGRPTHDPDELVRRAELLARDGVNLGVSRTTVPRALVERWGGAGGELGPTRLVVERGADGLRLGGIPPASALSAAGLRSGDVVSAVNGYELTSPSHARLAYDDATTRGRALVELARDGRRLVLLVTWGGAPPAWLPRGGSGAAPVTGRALERGRRSQLL